MAVKMRMSWARWEQHVLGRYIDMDGAYGAQCWDLWAHYAVNVWGAPLLSTYTAWSGSYAGLAGSLASQFPAREGIEKYFRKLSPGNAIRRGDVLVWGSNHIYPDTHVAIAAANAYSTDQQLDCISQNDGGAAAARGATRRGMFARSGLIGILRPRAAAASSASKPVKVPEIGSDLMRVIHCIDPKNYGGRQIWAIIGPGLFRTTQDKVIANRWARICGKDSIKVTGPEFRRTRSELTGR